MKYCNHCGHKISFGEVPEEDRERYYCDKCGTIHYENPNMIVGCLPRWQDKVLLCRRAIEPKQGLWTLPAGFLENGEKVEDGAIRETREEANADIEIVRLFSVYSLPTVGQVYLIFLANLLNLDFHPGEESTHVELFSKNEIPWDKIAFSSIRFTLDRYFNGKARTEGEVFLGALQPR